MAELNSTILDAVRLKSSNDFQQRVPQSVQGDITKSLQAMGDFPDLWNEFERNLFMELGNSIMNEYDWGNPLAIFKRDGLLPRGSKIAEYAFHMIKDSGYDPKDNNLFKLSPSHQEIAFHTLNRRSRYDLSTSYEELRTAFSTEYGVNAFLNAKLKLPALSDEYDEYRIMLQLIADIDSQKGFSRIKTTFADPNNPTESELKYLSRKVRAAAEKLGFPTGLYNREGVPTVSNKENLVLFVTPDTKAALDVNVLADAFHIDRTDFANRIITVDEFPVAGVHAMLIDKSWFVCADTVRHLDYFYNPKNMVNNFYYHRWGIYSASPFANAILFGEYDNTDIPQLSVTLTGLSASFVNESNVAVTGVPKGETARLVVKSVGTLVPENDTFNVPDGYTAEITLPNGITKTQKTFVGTNGDVFLQSGLPKDTVVTVKVTSTYVNPSEEGERSTISSTATLTVNETDD